jgi:hypothetical protein
LPRVFTFENARSKGIFKSMEFELGRALFFEYFLSRFDPDKGSDESRTSLLISVEDGYPPARSYQGEEAASTPCLFASDWCSRLDPGRHPRCITAKAGQESRRASIWARRKNGYYVDLRCRGMADTHQEDQQISIKGATSSAG